MTQSADAMNRELAQATARAVQAIFPLATSDGRTEVRAANVTITLDRFDSDDRSAHQHAREIGSTQAVPIRADLELWRGGKKVQSLRQAKIGDLPLQNEMGSFMVGGNDYFVPFAQARLKSGVYTREMDNGHYEAFIRLEGPAMKVWLDPEKGIFKLGFGTSNVDLVPVLQMLGMSEAAISQGLGGDLRAKQLMDLNRSNKPEGDLSKLFHAIFTRKQNRDLVSSGILETPEDALPTDQKATAINEWLKGRKIDPFVSRKTLGSPIDTMGADVLLRAARRILDIQRGDTEPDDRDAPEFKKMMGVSDLMEERVGKVSRMLKTKLLRRIGDPDVDLRRAVSTEWLNPATRGYFGGYAGVEGGLAHTAEAANPLAIRSESSKITVKGEGGIQSDHAISMSARLFRPSGINFYDPVHTPEGSEVGISVHSASAVRRRGTTMEAPFYLVKNRRVDRSKAVYLTLEETTDLVIGYPEYWDKTGKPKSPSVRANKNGQIEMVNPSEVKYVVPSGATVFDETSNAAAYLAHSHPNRAMMAGKHITQALPLVHRERHLSDLLDLKGRSINEALALGIVVRSKVDGTVTAVTKTQITVGSTKHSLFHHYPMQAKVSINHIPVVKVGDKVKKGQLLADTNYTKDGELALGVNLHSAYMPFRNASNFEDAIVVSEGASKKLASEHMHRMYLDIGDKEPPLVNKKLFTAQFPTVFPAGSYEKIGEDGVIKQGSKVSAGDVLVTAVRKKKFEEMDRSGTNLSRIHKILSRPYSDASLVWDEIFEGTVQKVIRTPKKIEIHILTEEPLQVGDKLSMSSAAKGTVSDVVPDDQMPRDAKGRAIEVVFNPFGVAGRMNPSQTIEQAAGKLVRDGGVAYSYSNFDDVDHARKVKGLLEKAGMKHAEKLYDPALGKWYEEPVATGFNYVFKLDHAVRKKFSARERDGYTMDEAPVSGRGRSGQSYDQLTTYALLGHNAHAILGESFGIRGAKNDDFWAAYQAGETPPPPKVPFIFEKFRTYLNAAGIDTQQKGNTMRFIPMTDKRILEMSNGAIRNARQIRAKDLAEEKGGLFDVATTGGLFGDRYSHIELGRKIPHPLYTKVLKDLTGIKMSDFYGLLGETRYYDPADGKFYDEPGKGRLTGQAAFEKMLDFNPKEKLRETKDKLRTAVGSDRNRYHRATKYLRGLQETGMKPADAYLTSVVPVVPPKYRSITEQRHGGLQVGDSNLLYRDLIMARDTVTNAEKAKDLPRSELAKARVTLYDSLAGLVGVGAPLTRRKDDNELQGFLQVIKGKVNKHGLFQRQLARRRNDYTGRSTVEPDASLGVDEIGLPEDMAWKIYKPMVIRRLAQAGWKPAEALKQVEGRTMVARQALDAEMKNRPVIYNRAPSLHRWNAAAAIARLTPGKEIKISPAVVGSQGMDFDGNCCTGDSLVTLMVDVMLRPREARAMRAIGSTQVLSEGPEHDIVRVRIDAIPRGNSRGKDRNGADVYELPEGFSVLTSDVDGKGARFSPATMLTVETGCRLTSVRTSRGFQVSVSDNESLAVYDHLTGQLAKRRPEDSVGALVPYVSGFPVPVGEEDAKSFGWMVGAFCGDGFCMGSSRRVGFTKLSANLRRYFESTMQQYLGLISSGTYRGRQGDSKLGDSAKDHYWAPDGIPLFLDCYVPEEESEFDPGDRAAVRKRLPVLNWTRTLALGVLAGLIDTDGTVSKVKARSKPKAQYQASITTSSPTLRDGIMDVCRMLNIRVSYSVTLPSEGRLQKHPSYLVSLSMMDLRDVTDLPVQTPKYQQLLAEARTSRMVEGRDSVPVPVDLWDEVRDKQLWEDQKLLASLRAAKNRAGFPSIVRPTARRAVLELKTRNLSPWVLAWERLILDTTTKWDRVKAVTEIPTETVFDLVVPETKVFVVNDGLIIYDTAAVHVPVTEEARRESYNLLPTKNLFYDRDRSLAYGLEKDVVAGLFVLTKPGRMSGQNFGNVDEAIQAFRNNKHALRMDSLVRIKGHPAPEAIGWLIFQQIVPKRFLMGIPPPIDGKKLTTILERIAKESPGEYNILVRRIAQAGFQAANSHGGITTTVDELVVDRTRINRLLDMMETAIGKGKNTEEKREIASKVYNTKVKPGLTDIVIKHVEGLNMGYGKMVESGATGKLKRSDPDPLRQMLASPTLVQDVKDRIVPSVIRTAYGPGMALSDYILTTPGARSGMVAKSLSTALPGFLAKEIAGNMGPIRIMEKDCGTSTGVEIKLSDQDVDILDRHLLRDVPGVGKRNDPVTTDLLARARDKKLKTLWCRSAMTCQAKAPPCQLCTGRGATGTPHPIGANIGLNYGQAVSERSTQLTLRAFHSGGTVGAGDSLTAGFKRLRELLSAPDIVRNQGTLSDVKGKVTEITPAPQGGNFITVRDSTGKDHKHYATSMRKVSVKVGASVDIGDPLSDGSYRPQEIAAKKGTLAAQQYVVDEARQAYQDAGATVRRPVLEVLAAGTMRYVEITDDGGDDGIAEGDIVHETEYAALRKGNPKIKGKASVPGISKKPLVSSTDLMERLNFQRLEDTFREIPAVAGTSDLTGAKSPIPGLAYGAMFRPAPNQTGYLAAGPVFGQKVASADDFDEPLTIFDEW